MKTILTLLFKMFIACILVFSFNACTRCNQELNLFPSTGLSLTIVNSTGNNVFGLGTSNPTSSIALYNEDFDLLGIGTEIATQNSTIDILHQSTGSALDEIEWQKYYVNINTDFDTIEIGIKTFIENEKCQIAGLEYVEIKYNGLLNYNQTPLTSFIDTEVVKN